MKTRSHFVLHFLSTKHLLSNRRLFSSWLSLQGNPIINWPLPQSHSTSISAQNANQPTHSQNDFLTLTLLLKDPNLKPGLSLQEALDRTGIKPETGLLEAIFEQFDSSPKLLFSLFLWAEKKNGFELNEALFNSMVNNLGKAKDFDCAWCLILDQRRGHLVSVDTFSVLIRRYTRAGMVEAAIRTFEYANGLELVGKSGLFEVLLDSLCKEGHVRAAADCFNRKKELESCWVPSIRVYNILLNGWFRARKLKHAERLWLQVKEENVVPTVVTYGTLVEGYCRMRRVEKAMELVSEMRRDGIEPNVIVYNPIIDALAEEGRFKEVLGMMERFLLCESGPTIATYNSLVKGYCKAKDLVGASKILKMMISRGIPPTPTTYNYFFRHFAKFGKIEEGMNLYTKMIESGYIPDRLTYHLLLKMLCEQDRLDLAVQISKEMRARGFDMDLATSTMLTHLLCKMHRFEEAFAEFEDMIRRGVVPQYLTFQILNVELRKHGKNEMAQKICNMMASVPHSTNLPNTYSMDGQQLYRQRRTCIIRKAEAMSEILKTCNDPRKLVKYRNSSVSPVSSANSLMENIKKRVNNA